MTTIPTDRPIRILIVDDDREFSTGLSKLLKEEGFEVHAEFNGNAALKLFQNKGFEVALIDGLLPGMDGFELCREIRWVKHGERMPIIMMSGVYRTANHAREATDKYRLTDYLEKPLKPTVLISALRKLFGRDYPSVQASAADDDAETSLRRTVNKFYLYKQDQLSLVGSLLETPFPVLLNQMFTRGLTGQLMLTYGQAKKLILFNKGRPIAISSNIINECLGRLLIKEGEINEETCNKTLAMMKETGRKHGECLLQAGAISSMQLSQALRMQFELKLYSVFTWTDASYVFKPKEQVPPGPVDIDIHPYAMIRDGLRLHTPQTQVEQWLKPYLSSPIEAAPDYQDKMSKGGFNLKETRFIAGLKKDDSLEDAIVNPLKTRSAMKPFMLTLIIIEALQLGQPTILEEDEETLTIDESMMGSGSQSILQNQVRMKMADGSSTDPGQLVDNPTATSKVRIEQLEMMQAMQMMTEEQKAVYTRLYTMRTKLRETTYFEFFEATEDTPPEEIKAKFLKLARQYHPDAIPFHEQPGIRTLADEVFTALSTASETLTNKQKRKDYIEFLAGGGSDDATEEIAKVLAAEQHFHNGQASARRKDWAGAKRAFQEALKLNPNEGEYYAELGWSHFNLSPHDVVSRQEAEKYLARAIEMAPKLASPHIYLGSIYKLLGDVPTAAQHYSEALKVDPKNARAKSEIRLLKMRKKEEINQKNKGGLFGGLFKKK
jgi:CheY-like chemotaxis protein/tetratricopeptide (TPR) repeat protein